VQPGPEGPPAVEAVECANRGEERFLGDVLGRRGVVDDEVGGPVGAGPVVPEKGLEVRGRDFRKLPRFRRAPLLFRRRVRRNDLRPVPTPEVAMVSFPGLARA